MTKRCAVRLKESGRIVGTVPAATLSRMRTDQVLELVLQGIDPIVAARAVMGRREARQQVESAQPKRSPAIMAFYRALAAED